MASKDHSSHGRACGRGDIARRLSSVCCSAGAWLVVVGRGGASQPDTDHHLAGFGGSNGTSVRLLWVLAGCVQLCIPFRSRISFCLVRLSAALFYASFH